MKLFEDGKSAVLSDDGLYRYELRRSVSDTGDVFAYFGINPSTADADVDDATVRKWRGFTERNGGRSFIVGNVFAFRTTDVKGLTNTDDATGPDNDSHILRIIEEADILIPHWGNSSKVHRSIRSEIYSLSRLLVRSEKPAMCFGKTKLGDPQHPLMLSYKTPLVPWTGYAA